MNEGPQVFGVDPFHGRGTKILEWPNKIVWECAVDENTLVHCTQELVEPLLESNQQLLNESAGQRFGDGKIIGRVDLPTYFKTILPAQKAGDQKWLKRFFNAPENRKYRVFPGSV